MIGLALAALIAAHSPAQTPVSSGEILLLSNSSDTSGAAAALKLALVNSDAGVRAAAARVIAVVPHGTLRADLMGALAREQDAKAGAEMVRDLALLSGAADLSMLDDQAHRLGADAALALAEWLARQRPQEFAERVASLAAIAGSRARELAPIVAMGGAQHPSDGDAIDRVWMGVAPTGAWDAILVQSVGGEGVRPRLTPVISDALDSPRQSVSEETVWFVLDCVIKKRPIAPEIVTKASRPREDVTAWEAFGRELLGRGPSATGATDRHEIVQREGPSHVGDIRRLHMAQQLTEPERDAVLAIIPLPKGTTFDVAGTGDAGHTVIAFAPGLINSTLEAAGCRGRGDTIGVSTITYGTDGRPRHIVIDPTGLSRECQAALAAFARTSLLPAAKPWAQDAPEKLMLPLTAGFVACADAPPAPRAPLPAGSLSHIAGPKKTKDVRPIYPAEAQRARIQGVVILEATISATGCLSDARVVRSIPYLDVPAMRAVLGWQFEPARVDGSPVPVFMTVTVNFALQ